mgnify:CR=1 FL=1
MPTYNAPLEDMLFLYEKLRDNKNYNEIDKYKEVTTDLVKNILDEAAKINQNLILPLAKAGDENPTILENGVVRTPPGYKEAYKKFIEDGWTSLSCDPKYGGQGMPRPQILQTRIFPGMFFANSIVLARAKDGSKAGNIPSVLQSIWKASNAF